jgi:DNA processing protein
MTQNRLLFAYFTQLFSMKKYHYDVINSVYADLEAAIVSKFAAISFPPKYSQFKEKITEYDFSDLDGKLNTFQNLLIVDRISFLFYFDDEYPAPLRNIENPPLVLFYQGDITLLNDISKIISVVGSRKIDKETQVVLPMLLKTVLQTYPVTISGIALGVDTLAHEETMKNGCKTIAVVGGGLDNSVFYPVDNISLQSRIIANGGLILSEHGPLYKPNKFTFPQRNRIIAALSNCLIVAQASLKSGSIITAEYAYKSLKPVYTLPSSMLNPSFSGNFQLVHSGKASFIFDINNPFNKEGVERKEVVTTKHDTISNILLSPTQTEIMNVIKSGNFDEEHLLIQTRLSQDILLMELTNLELDDLIFKDGVGCWQAN